MLYTVSQAASFARPPALPQDPLPHYQLQAALAELDEAKRRIEALSADLALLRGERLTPQEGCFHYKMSFGESEVVVEFEHEAEDGDGFNTPHYEESIKPICVFVNGKWSDVDGNVDPALIQRWTEEAWERRDAERDAEAEAAAEARAEDRRIEALL